VRIAADDHAVIVEIQDTGRGIDPAALPFVFDTFRQADGSSTRSHGGLGLGLSIVRHIVEAHGGTVTAVSRGAGQGACFTVRLPIGGETGSSVTPDDGVEQQRE
jgi:signal transduction histidine kinase